MQGGPGASGPLGRHPTRSPKGAEGFANRNYSAQVAGIPSNPRSLVCLAIDQRGDGTVSELSERASRFARRLQGRYNIDVHMVDERLTSREAKSMLQEQQRSGVRKGKMSDLTKIDHLAAALILQTWLENPDLGESP